MDGFNFLRLSTLSLLVLCNGMGSSKFLHYELVSDLLCVCVCVCVCVKKIDFQKNEENISTGVFI